jgi:hypothetical protein
MHMLDAAMWKHINGLTPAEFSKVTSPPTCQYRCYASAFFDALGRER